MLISLTVKNWMSFQDETEFSMLASKERGHGDRVARVKKYGIGILPVAVLYGGNASGKSNFFRVLNFAKRFIVRSTRPDGEIPVQPFILSDAAQEQPSYFKFTLLIADQIYEYSFEVTRKAVLKEKLVQVNKTSEKLLYSRDEQEISLGKKFPNQKFLDFTCKSTRGNMLFLTNSVSQNVEHFRMVYDWFASFGFEPFVQPINNSDQFQNDINRLLPQLDTGISRFDCVEYSFDNIGSIPPEFKDSMEEELNEGEGIRFGVQSEAIKDERVIFTKKNGKVIVQKPITYHKSQDGGEVEFMASQESDGTNRLLDLLPAFIDLDRSNGTKLYAIDEIDRSLHTLLVEELIELYLAGCSPDTRKQLFFTTHNVMLMDQKLFRRDEMWLTERDSDGASKLFPFSDFKGVRHDKDVRRSYLQGRLGGIPDIANIEMPTDDSDEHES